MLCTSWLKHPDTQWCGLIALILQVIPSIFWFSPGSCFYSKRFWHRMAFCWCAVKKLLTHSVLRCAVVGRRIMTHDDGRWKCTRTRLSTEKSWNDDIKTVTMCHHSRDIQSSPSSESQWRCWLMPAMACSVTSGIGLSRLFGDDGMTVWL